MNAIIREKQLLQSPFPSFGMSPSDPPITVSQRWDEPIRSSDYRFPALGRAHPTPRSPFPSFGTGSSDPPIIISQRWDEPAALVRWDFQDSPRFIPYVHVKGCSLAGNLSNAISRLIFVSSFLLVMENINAIFTLDKHLNLL